MNQLNEECYVKEKFMRVPTETAKNLYFFSEWAGTFSCKKDFRIHRKQLNSYLLLYTTSGQGLLHYQSQDYVITPGSVLLLDCRIEHEYFTRKAPWKFQYIHFNGNLSEKYYDYIRQLCASPVLSPELLSPDRLFDRVVSDVKECRDEAISSSHIYQIITALIHGLGSHDTSFHFQKVMQYISEHYTEITDIGSVAALFNLSRSHFTVQFKKATGWTPYDYLIQCRISAAKQMICNTNQSLGSILEACGFYTYSSFLRAFKNKTGLSPSAYKNLVLHHD